MEIETAATTFKSIWFAPSFILGLGITRLTSDSITLFRGRSRAKIDPIPILWAVSTFVWQIQYLWAVIELSSYARSWSILDFLLLIGLSLSLFIASALILPDAELSLGDDLTQSFFRDGRWALAALSFWGFLAILTDWHLFATHLLGFETILMGLATILPVGFLVLKNRWLQATVTIAYLALTLTSAWILSPKTYG